MGIKKRSLAIVVTLTSLLVLFQNCSEQQFSQQVEHSVKGAGDVWDPDATGRIDQTDNDFPGIITQTGGPNCRDELQSLVTPVRVLAIVDTSGSNVEGEKTDPDRAVRSGSIQRFYNTYATKANFNWGFITFAGTSARALIGSSNSQPAFNNSAAMNSAIATFTNIQDIGATPYQAALNLAKKAITDDTARPAGSKYIVVFISDGLPNPDVSVNTLKSEVTNLINILPGQVTFNTVYYGNYNAQAANRLQEMAASGLGNFLDTNANPTGTAFSITDLVTIPGVICTP